MGRPPETIPNWTFLDPRDNDADNKTIGEVLTKLIKTHKKVRYYRKLSIKHLRKFMKDQPIAKPNPSGLESWRGAMYSHAKFNALFFMRRNPNNPKKPRYCLTVAPVAAIAAGAYSAALDALNELAWNFQQFTLMGLELQSRSKS